MQGLVVAAYGKRYEVELADQLTGTVRRISCVTRGKKTDLACGDIVTIKLTDSAEGVVESSAPRKSLLYRSSSIKSKILAANVTQIIIVLATQPSFYEALLNRCLVAAEAANIKPLIVLNKCDLTEANEAKSKLKLYETLGYQVVTFISQAKYFSIKALSSQSSKRFGWSVWHGKIYDNKCLTARTKRTHTNHV
jgi:ribosome biogenesis GTPase / thiamine phosphate phosphatase